MKVGFYQAQQTPVKQGLHFIVQNHRQLSVPLDSLAGEKITRLAIDRRRENNASREGIGKEEPLPQFSLGSFTRSSLTELVFVINSPARMTEKEQLAV